MRGVVLTAYGSADHLEDAELLMPECGLGDIRIAVKAVSFNPIDYQLAASPYGSAKLPVVLGFDVAGLVAEVGAAVLDLKIGDEVMAYLGGPSMAGGYAEHAVAPRGMVALKPRNIGFAEAAAIPLTALTGLQCLRRARIGPGQSLLVAGAAGGAGSWVALIAQVLGVTRIAATAGRGESRAYLSDEIGISPKRLIDYRDGTREDLAARAIAANDGALYDVCVDCAGDAMTHLCCDVVDIDGHVVSIVNGPDASDENPLFDKSATFHSELIYAAAESGDPARYEVYAQQLAELTGWIESGALRLPRIADLGPLSTTTVREAHRQLAAGRTIGKLVARVN
jgi:NADPH:quinone reductase-like Zn-dependent oxidoreductase